MNPKPKRIVISYFEAFGDLNLNSSKILAEQIRDTYQNPKLELLFVELPVVFEEAHLHLENFLADNEWDGVLMMGQAAKRKKISLELLAKNIQDPRFPDNKGQSPGGKILTWESDTLPSTWDFENFIQKLPPDIFELSNNAGEYVCNELFFRNLSARSKDLKISGFVHVPLLPPQREAALTLENAKHSFAQLLELCGRQCEQRNGG